MFCPRSLLLPAILAVSAAAHAGVFVSIATGPRIGNTPSVVEITVAPTPPPPPPPAPREPVVEPARVATSVPRTQPVRRAAPAPSKAPAPAPASQPPPPADFTGTTLTNDSGEAWSTQTGNGAPLAGPIAAPSRVEQPAPRPAAPAGPPLVALADLSRPPRAPNLDAALAHHYPTAARQRGISGKAVIRARIAADGKARVLGVVSESYEGLGAACHRTLDGSRWDPPQDRAGQPVATELTYTCRFEVGS